MVTMVNDPRDFVPYLPTILPALKVVLLDPIPDCRSTAAKALGSLTRVLGEATFPEVRYRPSKFYIITFKILC